MGVLEVGVHVFFTAVLERNDPSALGALAHGFHKFLVTEVGVADAVGRMHVQGDVQSLSAHFLKKVLRVRQKLPVPGPASPTQSSAVAQAFVAFPVVPLHIPDQHIQRIALLFISFHDIAVILGSVHSVTGIPGTHGEPGRQRDLSRNIAEFLQAQPVVVPVAENIHILVQRAVFPHSRVPVRFDERRLGVVDDAPAFLFHEPFVKLARTPASVQRGDRSSQVFQVGHAVVAVPAAVAGNVHAIVAAVHAVQKAVAVHEENKLLRLDQDLVILVLYLEIEEIHFSFLGEHAGLVMEGALLHPHAALVQNGEPKHAVDDHGIDFRRRLLLGRNVCAFVSEG